MLYELPNSEGTIENIMCRRFSKLLAMLLREEYFSDAALYVVSFEIFKVNGVDNLANTRENKVLRSFVSDNLETDFVNKNTFVTLLQICMSNLESLQNSGILRHPWRQPFAKFPNDPPVEEFLKSDEVTFVYNHFQTIDEADVWISELSGSCDKYSFLAIARQAGNGVQVILQKEIDWFEKTKLKYFDLMVELENLKKKLHTLSQS